jgi:UDPglucose 6-dehydrogenase
MQQTKTYDIAIVGGGYLGLVTAAGLAELGHCICVIESDAKKLGVLQGGGVTIYEPGLEQLFEKHRNRIKFTDAIEAVAQSQIVFVAVGTPTDAKSGRSDLSYLYSAVHAAQSHLQQNSILVIKSTVPVGTNRKLQELINQAVPDGKIQVVSNPEFLREGSAIYDFLNPDRIVFGVESAEAEQIMREVYAPLQDRTAFVFVNLESAETIKYAANAFLATKISFINQIADFCEMTGASVDDVAHGMGLDRRIGQAFLNAGPGYGGSCFPKDVQSLIIQGKDQGLNMDMIAAVRSFNDFRKINWCRRMMDRLGDIGVHRPKKIAILGYTFKANTDDLRDTPALEIVSGFLQSPDISICAYDPAYQTRAPGLFARADQNTSNLKWVFSASEALSSADAAVIITEWDEFRKLDLVQLKLAMRRPVVFDLRNLFDPAEMKLRGFEYFSVGRGSGI